MANNKHEGLIPAYFLIALAVILFFAKGGTDSLGWMPHEEESVITAQSNWFVGESKDCMSYPLDAKSAQVMNKPKGYAISQINCDGGPEHTVKIKFYGRTEQPEYTWINWRCTRNEGSFTCKQTGNSERTDFLTGKDNATGRPTKSYDGGKTWQWADQQ